MNIAQRLPSGDRVALEEPSGRTVTFDDLRARAESLAGALRTRVSPGDPLLLLLPVAIDLYHALAGMLLAEATAVVVDPGAGLRRMRDVLRDVGLRGVVGTRTVHALRLLMPELRGGAVYACPDWVPLTERLSDVQGTPGAQDVTDPERIALLTFTTGSTGTPKAIPRSHGLLDAQRAALQRHMALTPDDVDLATLPIFALSSLAAGARVRIADADLRAPGTAQPSRIAAQLASGVTTCSASPAFFRQIVRSGRVYPGVRAVHVGGARVPARLLREMCRVFPNAGVHVLYGSSEAEPIAAIDARACIDDIDAAERDGTGALVGHAVDEVAVRLRAVDTGQDVSHGEIGEVCVAGAHVVPSYWRDPESDARTKESLLGHVWHRTGDLARLDATGRLVLVGRVGESVAGHLPLPVESAAERVAGVTRAALMPDRELPLVVYSGSAPESDVRAATGIASVLRVPEIPVDRRHNAKIDRARLRALLAARS
jgi:acyl-CoA synthetase (AMP-forming)/AMP-acid ligase II